MPELTWDELDFLECLEAVPEADEDSLSYGYDVRRSGHRLLVTVFPYESVVRFTLWPDTSETPLAEFALYVREGVRHVNDKRGEYLEFQDCVMAPSRFWYIEAGDPFSRGRFAHGVTLQLRIKPGIGLRFI